MQSNDASGHEKERDEVQATEGDQLISDISSSCEFGSDAEGESFIRAQWFDEVVKADTDNIRRLLQLGADIGWEDFEKRTALYLTVRSGHKEVVDLLIEHGAAVDARDEDSDTPLHLAAMEGHKDVVDMLINHGAT
ncbi:hypothetical protein K450DRAFT_274699, partial [Umbelopsis ramanniana AG]